MVLLVRVEGAGSVPRAPPAFAAGAPCAPLADPGCWGSLNQSSQRKGDRGLALAVDLPLRVSAPHPDPGEARDAVGVPRPRSRRSSRWRAACSRAAGWSRDAFLPRCILQANSCWKFLHVSMSSPRVSHQERGTRRPVSNGSRGGAGSGSALGLSRPPVSCLGAESASVTEPRPEGAAGPGHISLRSFHLCFLLDSREKGEAVPGKARGSRAPAFPSGLQPCCIPGAGLCLQPGPLAGFTAPGAALGALGSLVVLGEGAGRPWSKVWVGAGWGGGSWRPRCAQSWSCAVRGGRGAVGTSGPYPYPYPYPARPEHPALLPGPGLELCRMQAGARQRDTGPGGAASPALGAAPHGA